MTLLNKGFKIVRGGTVVNWAETVTEARAKALSTDYIRPCDPTDQTLDYSLFYKPEVGDLVTVLNMEVSTSIGSKYINNLSTVVKVDDDNTTLLRLLEDGNTYWFATADIKKL